MSAPRVMAAPVRVRVRLSRSSAAPSTARMTSSVRQRQATPAALRWKLAA